MYYTTNHLCTDIHTKTYILHLFCNTDSPTDRGSTCINMRSSTSGLAVQHKDSWFCVGWITSVESPCITGPQGKEANVSSLVEKTSLNAQYTMYNGSHFCTEAPCAPDSLCVCMNCKWNCKCAIIFQVGQGSLHKWYVPKHKRLMHVAFF